MDILACMRSSLSYVLSVSFPTNIQIDDSGYISLLDVNTSASNLPLATPYNPTNFPLNSSNTGIDWSAVVAPYWYDVDTRGNRSGMIYYKNVTRDTDSDVIGEIDSLAKSHLCDFATTWSLIVTWDHVGYYNSKSDKVSSDDQRSSPICTYIVNYYLRYCRGSLLL